MRPIPVQDGLWTFYAFNPGSGIALRWHPVDRQDVKIMTNSSTTAESVDYYTTQRIYCDKMVTHPDTGVNYYRVQGTRGWVFDRRKRRTMLLGEDQVREGLFAYRCIKRIEARAFPSIEDKTRVGWSVKVTDLVVADFVMDESSPGASIDASASGPYFHLTGGIGWMFEYKLGVKSMEQIPMEDGTWVLRALNRIALRAQPIDDGGIKLETLYQPHAAVKCDKRIKSPSSGTCFYRVSGTTGWVFDKRDDIIMMELVSSGTPTNDMNLRSSVVQNGWTPDFVRGVAAVVDGMQEISFNEQSRLISFRSTNDVRINVYYTTRTVGTALFHPHQGKTQLFRRDCDVSELMAIFVNPRLHTDKGYQRKRKLGNGSHSIGSVRSIPIGSNEYIVDIEDELRQELCAGEKELGALKAKQAKLTDRIAGFNVERQRAADKINAETSALMGAIAERAEAARKKELAIAEAARQKKLTCPICSRVFTRESAMQQHKRDSHGFTCEHCFRSFNNNHGLDQHRSALGHW
jgi:uncharacterized C2H2 Zn-finger protein